MKRDDALAATISANTPAAASMAPVYVLGMSHMIPVLRACEAAREGIYGNFPHTVVENEIVFVDWNARQDLFPTPIKYASIHPMHIPKSWGTVLAERYAPSKIGFIPGFKKLVQSIPTNATLFAFIEGSEYRDICLREDVVPYDFELPGRPDLSLLPGRQVVPFPVIERLMEAEIAKALAVFLAIRCLQSQLRIVNVICPPPIATRKLNMKFQLPESMFAPDSVRLKHYLVYRAMIERSLQNAGIYQLLPPQEAVDSDGCLREEFIEDTYHGNGLYGALVLRQMRKLLGEDLP